MAVPGDSNLKPPFSPCMPNVRVGAMVGHAAAVAEADGPHAGVDALNAIDSELTSSYQPYWAVRAHLLQQNGNSTEAVRCFDRAIGLAEDPAVRAFLLGKRG
jgi:RNA polymerase sigma-70 factor, ECF subfamily